MTRAWKQCKVDWKAKKTENKFEKLAEQKCSSREGIEPSTSRLTVARSNQLSYPDDLLVIGETKFFLVQFFNANFCRSNSAITYGFCFKNHDFICTRVFFCDLVFAVFFFFLILWNLRYLTCGYNITIILEHPPALLFVRKSGSGIHSLLYSWPSNVLFCLSPFWF